MPTLSVKFSLDRLLQGVLGKMLSSLSMTREVNMKDYVKYGRARDQLYHLAVLWSRLIREHRPAKPTPEYTQAEEMVTLVLEQCREAMVAGQILALQLDRYDVRQLPGFEEQFPEMKNPYQVDGD